MGRAPEPVSAGETGIPSPFGGSSSRHHAQLAYPKALPCSWTLSPKELLVRHCQSGHTGWDEWLGPGRGDRCDGRERAVRRRQVDHRRRRTVHGVVQPHTAFAVRATSSSFCRCTSGVMRFPSHVEAKPHCGLNANRSSGTYLAASMMRRISSS